MKHYKIRTSKKITFWHRHQRLLRWVLGFVAAIVVFGLAIFMWFALSPWPGAMIVRWEFNQNGAKTTASLKSHEPASGVVVMSEQYLLGEQNTMLDIYTPQEAVDKKQKRPVVFWTHGGAWLSGDKTDTAAYFKLLAQAGFTVIAPNYSLAPEKAYPTQIHQLNTAHAYIQRNAERLHADTDNIILAGDSAGSQLTAQLAALITNPLYAQEVGVVPTLKPQQLKGTVLTCGIYKMELLAHPAPELSKIISWGDTVTVWAYSGTKDFSKPVIKQMSPYYHVTKNFPPTFITGGNGDPLTATQSKPFADLLQMLGVQVTGLFYDPNHTPALPHEYQFNLDTPDGKKALEYIITFIRTHTQ